MSKHPPDTHSSERIGLRARLADPRLISWPTFAISSALLSYEIWLHGLLDFIAAQVVVFSLLFVARVLYLKRRYPSHHAWVMVTTIVVTSLFGAILAQLLFAEANTLVTVDGAFTRMIVIPAAGLLSVSLIDYRNNVNELRATAAQLELTRDAGLQSLTESRERIVNQVQASLEDALSDLRGGDRSDLAAELAHLAQETVRPLSHELARSTPDFTPADPAPQRLRWSAILTEVAAKPLIVPWLMALAVAVMSIRFTFAQSDVAVGSTLVTLGPVTVSMDAAAVATSLGFLLVVFVAVWLLSATAVRITRPILTRASGGVRWLVIAISVIGIGIGLQIVLIVLPILPGPLSSIDTDPIGRFLAFAPVVLIALVLAIARTVSFARAAVLDELTSINSELTWEVARIRLDLWAQQRRFAQAIHGPLQAAITASALLLNEAPASDRRTAISAAHDRIKPALDRLSERTDVVATWFTGINEIQRTWDGVCQVNVEAGADATHVLEQDDTCRQAALLVIGESVANAAIHGKSTRVNVFIAAQGWRFLILEIDDDGSGPSEGGSAGLGTELLNDVCATWTREHSNQGTRIQAILATDDQSSSERLILSDT